MRSHQGWGLFVGRLTAGGVGLLVVSVVLAQQPEKPLPPLVMPRLFVVTPAGGQAGSTLEVVVTGPDMDDAAGLLFSHSGIKAEVVAPEEAPADPKKPTSKKQPQTGPLASARFKVTIPPNTPLGIHDVRVVSKWGVSNARAFVVGDLPEAVEREPNNDVPEAQRIELNTTVHGNIAAPTDVDYFVFAGKKGQRVVASCLASSIDSRLRAAVEVYDAAGRPLGYNHHFSDADALVDVSLPADGDYYVRLYYFTYTQGGNEHFYRLTVSTAPWIDAVVPPVVEPGKSVQLTVYGRNLPGGQVDPEVVVNGRALERATVTVQVPGDAMAQQRLAHSWVVWPKGSSLDGFEFRLRNSVGSSNPCLLTFARGPVVTEQGNNDTPESAQRVPVPCDIAGQIERRRDGDWYLFDAKKGQPLSLEVVSDRRGAPTYMKVSIINPADKRVLADLEDIPDSLVPYRFLTRTSDPPRFRFVPPADGPYLLQVRSQVGDTLAGPHHQYVVRLGPERPDFRLIVMASDPFLPDALVLHQDGQQYLDVFVWRLDDYQGEITLTAEGLPPGVTCQPQVIGPGVRHAVLVLSAAADAPEWTGSIQVLGRATIGGETVVREARPAGMTWPVPRDQNQPQAIAVSRLERNVALAVRGKAPFKLDVGTSELVVKPGEKANLPLKLARHWPELKVPVQVSDALNPPGGRPRQNNQPLPGININGNQPLTIAPDKSDGTVNLEVPANFAPGTYTIALRASAQVTFSKDPMAKQKPNVTVAQASPPVTVRVIPRELAKLSAANPAPAKLGGETELIVKVARLYNYAGEFKVQVILPPDLKGVSAEEATLAPGQEEARIKIKVAPDAATGTRNGLVVRASTLYQGTNAIEHEVKFNLTINK
ncbi:MAG: hypothetical protein NZ700_16770 [Gemmataceae bacterium]|nr:hypothetical protein [Gemmataceae bacterium]MDW8264403.1 hypothetical protein [Gemmataceae bacterium]